MIRSVRHVSGYQLTNDATQGVKRKCKKRILILRLSLPTSLANSARSNFLPEMSR